MTEKKYAYIKKWRKENPDKVKATKRRYEQNNKEAHRKHKNNSQKRQVERMNDNYIIHLLTQTSNLKYKDIRINKSLIEAHRMILKINRNLNQKQNVTRKTNQQHN